MKTKEQLLYAYDLGRSNLLLMIVLTTLNVVLAVLDVSITYLFTALFPYFAAVQRDVGWLGLSAPVSVILFSVLPIAVLVICWLLSKEGKYGWLAFASGLFVVDTFYMFFFLMENKFQWQYIIIILYHVFTLWVLINGTVSGYQASKGDYEDETDGLEPNTAEADDCFRYDSQYAKATGASKTGSILLTAAGSVAAAVIGAVIIVKTFFETDVEISSEMQMAIFFGYLVLIVVLAIALVIKLSPFMEAFLAVYRVEGGVLKRSKTDIPPFNYTEFRNIKIIETRSDRWIISYENAKGKRKKMVIPNAYPGLELFMAELEQH